MFDAGKKEASHSRRAPIANQSMEPGSGNAEKKVYEKSAATKGTIRDALKVRSGTRLSHASPLQ